MKYNNSALACILLLSGCASPNLSDFSAKKQAMALCGNQYRISDGVFHSDHIDGIKNNSELSPALKQHSIDLFNHCIVHVESELQKQEKP